MEVGDSGIPVDCGWAWVCVFGVCLTNVFVYGGYRSFGILFVEFLEAFNAGSGMTAWVAGIIMMCNTVTPTIGGALSLRYGSRPVVMTGGVLAAIGAVGTSFVTSIHQVIFVYGIFTGVGYGLCYTPSMAILGHYFQKRYALATGLAVAGTCIGQFILPLVIRYLVDTFAFRGAMMVFGGLVLNICAAAALYRPPEFYTKYRSKFLTLRNVSLNRDTKPTQQSTPGFTKDELNRKQIMNGNNNLIRNEIGTESSGSTGNIELKTSKHSNHINGIRDNLLITTSTGQLSARSALSLNGYHSSAFFSSMGSLHFEHTLSQKHLNKKTVGLNSLPLLVNDDTEMMSSTNRSTEKKSTCSLFNFSVFTNMRFVLYLVAVSIGNIGCMNMVIIIPDHARNIGIDKNNTALLVSLLGAADLLSRISFGALADLKCVKRFVLPHHFVLASLAAVSVLHLLCPLFPTKPMMFGYCILTGLALGGYMCMMTVVLREMVGIVKLPSALAFVLTAFGIGNTLGPPAMGYIRDITGSYNPAFRLAGICTAVGAFILLFEPLARRHEERKLQHKDIEKYKDIANIPKV